MKDIFQAIDNNLKESSVRILNLLIQADEKCAFFNSSKAFKIYLVIINKILHRKKVISFGLLDHVSKLMKNY